MFRKIGPHHGVQPGGMMPPMQRIGYLDGLRGLAALQVVLLHYVEAFAPTAVPTLGFAVDGNVAVLLFFLLSGRVLTPAYARAPDAVLSGLGRRVIRLGLPLLAASAFALALEAALPDWRAEAAALAGSDFLARQQVSLAAWQALAELTGLSMLTGYDHTTLIGPLAGTAPALFASANLPAWSLHLELLGSALVLVLVWARSRSELLHLVLVSAGLALIGGNALVLFILGHAAALLEPWPPFRRLLARRAAWALGALLLALGIFLAEHSRVPGVYLTERVAMAASKLHRYDWFAWHKEVAAVLIFFGVMLVPPVQALLRMRLPVWLGQVSFGLYLLHWPVMITLGSLVFLSAQPLGADLPALLAVAAGLAVTLPLAVAFTRWVDAPAMRLARGRRLVSSEVPAEGTPRTMGGRPAFAPGAGPA
jgi:peptidoglycan/LPS O-acetylase OafA/YrhL